MLLEDELKPMYLELVKTSYPPKATVHILASPFHPHHLIFYVIQNFSPSSGGSI